MSKIDTARELRKPLIPVLVDEFDILNLIADISCLYLHDNQYDETAQQIDKAVRKLAKRNVFIKPDKSHYTKIIGAISHGQLIPFLGAGVNLASRPPDYDWNQKWDPKSGYLPNGKELSVFLADRFNYPADDNHDLLRVTQYIATIHGEDELNDELFSLFCRSYRPSAIHQFLASLPQFLRKHGKTDAPLIIMTTNYDHQMEDAFRMKREIFQVLSYIRIGDNQGKFLHYCPTKGWRKVIHRPLQYVDIDPDMPVILKFHGDATSYSYIENRSENSNIDIDRIRSFVATEDSYITYLSQGPIVNRLPVELTPVIIKSSFLFLGYSLNDWTMRAFFDEIKSDRMRHWAVAMHLDAVTRAIWESKYLELYDMDVDTYINKLYTQFSAR